MVRFLSALFGFFCVSLILAGCALGAIYWYFSKDLPSYRQLAEYRPPVISRVYANNGKMIGEFAKERRLYTPIDSIPLAVKQAFVAAEDKDFYKHPGVDIKGIIRAALTNIGNIGQGRRMQGASTITQQVMKNFLLSHEQKFERKIKEAILATRFEKTFSKDHILELYLNEIYLGVGTYGITAAAQIYFNKTLDELTLAETAYLAALPKAPNNYHPRRYKERAITRRNYVIGRMLEDGYITQAEADKAKSEQLVATLGKRENNLDASYFVEEVRRDLLSQYGESVLYNAGLTITATIDPELQRYAETALRIALIKLDRKLGWRGPIAKKISTKSPEDSLKPYRTPRDLYNWRTALVTGFSDDNTATIYIKENKEKANILFDTSKWAYTSSGYPKNMSNILSVGDVVYVEKNNEKDNQNDYLLRQIPKVNGAMMAMDPHTGRVLAQQGGFSFSQSQFNRATQAKRQPGSAFKPFVYAAALERGYSPATLVNDGPFYYKDALGRLWKPQNYDKTYLGNVTMRTGLERSRNLMTIRIAQDIGMTNVISFAQRFGVADKMKPYLPMSLGAGETTLEKMVSAYAVFANGGKKVTPVYYDRIQDRNGKTIVSADIPVCPNCLISGDNISDRNEEYLLDPITNYQVTSLLKGVVERGTGRTLKSLGVPIAGKTGTTNESKDVWFLGYTSNLVFGTYIGYDNPKPMGRKATGGGTAAPAIKEFLKQAINKVPAKTFSVPKGVQFVNVRKTTGEYSDKDSTKDKNTVKEAFHPGQEPKKTWYRKEKFDTKKSSDYFMPEHIEQVDDLINLGTGGLY